MYLFTSRADGTGLSIGTRSTFWTLRTIFSTWPKHSRLPLWTRHKERTTASKEPSKAKLKPWKTFKAPHPVSLESHVSLETWETVLTLKYHQSKF